MTLLVDWGAQKRSFMPLRVTGPRTQNGPPRRTVRSTTRNVC